MKCCWLTGVVSTWVMHTRWEMVITSDTGTEYDHPVLQCCETCWSCPHWAATCQLLASWGITVAIVSTVSDSDPARLSFTPFSLISPHHTHKSILVRQGRLDLGRELIPLTLNYLINNSYLSMMNQILGLLSKLTSLFKSSGENSFSCLNLKL